jgi:hypothetical protein
VHHRYQEAMEPQLFATPAWFISGACLGAVMGLGSGSWQSLVLVLASIGIGIFAHYRQAEREFRQEQLYRQQEQEYHKLFVECQNLRSNES